MHCCRQRRSENFWKKIQMKNDLVLGFCFYHSKRGCPGNKCHRQHNFFRFRRRVFQCGKENPAGFPSDAFKVLMNRGNFKTPAETRVIKTTEAEIFRNPKANGTAGEKDEFGNLIIFCEKCSNSILPQGKELLLKGVISVERASSVESACGQVISCRESGMIPAAFISCKNPPKRSRTDEVSERGAVVKRRCCDAPVPGGDG